MGGTVGNTCYIPDKTSVLPDGMLREVVLRACVNDLDDCIGRQRKRVNAVDWCLFIACLISVLGFLWVSDPIWTVFFAAVTLTTFLSVSGLNFACDVKPIASKVPKLRRELRTTFEMIGRAELAYQEGNCRLVRAHALVFEALKALKPGFDLEEADDNQGSGEWRP